MNAHVNDHSAHAVYAPSSAHRWMNCTASANAIAALGEQEEGDAAKEGTEAHSELERVLKGGSPDPDHPAAYGVALFVNYVKQLPPGQVWIEERVRLTDHIWGRLDFGHWHAESATVTIVDKKNGFVGVDAEENEQLRIYGAALIQQHRLPARFVRYVIVQPNDFRPVPRIKQWIETVEDLNVFSTRAAAVPYGSLSFVAGEQCTYCPLFGRCEASKDILVQLAVMMANPPDQVPPAQIALFKATEKPVTDWFKALDKAATKAALAGSVPPGMKLVQTVKHRTWKDEAAARSAIMAVHGVDVLSPPTPAQAEKLGGLELSAMIDTPEGGPALAFESDKRKAWAPKSAAEMFAGVLPK